MFRKTLIYYLSLVAGALLLITPAFYNGYPLVNSDTSTYITSGFVPDAPWDRPITYGLLLRIFSLNGTSMWAVVFMQGYILAWLISLIVKHTRGNRPYLLHALIIITILSATTSLSWVSSELIADVYTPVGILCILLLSHSKQNKTNRALLYLLYFTSAATHISHLAIYVLLVTVLLVFRRYIFTKEQIRYTTRQLLTMLMLSLSTIGIMGVAISKSGHMFMMGSFVEKGVLKKYLDNECGEVQYALCKYKDELPEVNAFLWDKNSPLQKEGGWKNTKEEYNNIINNVLTTPGYLLFFIQKAISGTIQSLGMYRVGDGNTPFPAGSNVYNTLDKYIPHETACFENSRQNTNRLLDRVLLLNIAIYISVMLSCTGLCFLLLWKQNLNKKLAFIMLICIAGIIINSADCATFAQVHSRYNCRIIWLIPFCVLLSFLNRQTMI